MKINQLVDLEKSMNKCCYDVKLEHSYRQRGWMFVIIIVCNYVLQFHVKKISESIKDMTLGDTRYVREYTRRCFSI